MAPRSSISIGVTPGSVTAAGCPSATWRRLSVCKRGFLQTFEKSLFWTPDFMERRGAGL
jgi:hypothetical protein